MAADGSLNFDTKINIDGFEDGISTLSKAMNRLTSAVERLSGMIINGFNGAQESVEKTTQKAQETAGGMDDIAEAAKRAEKEAAELQKQMDQIQVHQMEDIPGAQAPEQKREMPINDPGAYGYDQSAVQFVEEFGKAESEAAGHTNEFRQTIEALQSELKSLEGRGYYFGDEEYDTAFLKLAKVKQALADYKKEMLSPASDSGAQELLELKQAAEVSDQSIIELVARLEELKARQAELSRAGVGLGYREYEENARAIGEMTADLKKYQKSLTASKPETQQYVGVLASVRNGFAIMRQELAQMKSAVAKGFKTAPIKLFKTALSGALAITKKLASGLKRMGLAGIQKMAQGAARAFKQLGKTLLGVGKDSQKAQKGFSMLSMLGKSIMFSLVFRAISAIGTAFKEGIQNFAQYSGSFNSIMSSFTSSLGQLKNSFAAAFSPVTSVVIPILDALVQKLITVINVIGQFLAAITGKGTFTKAIKVNKDYAAGLKQTGGAAQKAGQDAKKALAPFDDLVQIQRQEDAGAGGGGGAGGVDPSQMFTEEQIDGGISDFANKLREMFEAGNWAGIGQLIGTKINEAVQSFTQYISWENVGAKITSFVTEFTTLFNSLVATIDWYSIGIMMGTGINTLAMTLYLLLTQIDWLMLGNALASGLNGMVDTVDWDLFGATIGAYFQARLAALYGFVSMVDWAGIGLAIGTALNGMTGQIDWQMLGLFFANGMSGVFQALYNTALTFDWVGFGSSISLSLSTLFQNFDWSTAGAALSLFVLGLLNFLITIVQQTDWAAFVQGIVTCMEAIDWIGLAGAIFTLFSGALGTVFGALANFLGTLIADGVSAAKEYFQGKIEECGGNIWLGIAKGLLDAIKGIGTWIHDNIFKPFMDGFKNAFGIHSPSTVMAEMGQYLWDGFCNGIKEFFASPIGFIEENITGPFVDGIKNLLGIHSPSAVLEEVGANTVAGFNQGVEGQQSASQGVVQSWASGVMNWFSSKLGISSGSSAESQRWATDTMSGFNNEISTKYKNSQSVMENWATNIRNWFIGQGETKGVNQQAWRKFADDIIKAFRDMIIAGYTETQEPTETWAESLRKWFVGENEMAGVNEASWKKFADQIIQAFKEKIAGSYTETQTPMETWSKQVREWFWGDSNLEGTGGLYDAFYQMAKRINEGFAKGISDFAHLAKDAIRKWAREAMEEAEEEFDINSPSKEFHTIAEYVVRGFNEGILDMARSSRAVMQSWLDGVMGVVDGAGINLPVGISLPNASSYLPRVSLGAVVPPGAGEMAVSMRTRDHEEEAALRMLLERIEEMIGQLRSDQDRPITIMMQLTGNMAALARVLKPQLDKEAARKGVNLVLVGG